jgi:hypothetical protein
MPDRERRKSEHELISALKRELNDDQRDTLAQLERFGWTLKFVRRPVFQDPVGVIMNPDTHTFAVIEVDGTLNEKAALLFRE